jgi:hypothetical protein
MYVLLTDPACGLLLLHATCHRAASVEIRRRIWRLNDSDRIGDIRGESAMPQIPDESLRGSEPTRWAINCHPLRSVQRPDFDYRR